MWQVDLKYSDSLVLKKNENNVLCGYKVDKEAKIEFERKKNEDNLVKFRNMIGFRQVFNALVALKKPVVGHNLLFDLMFIQRWLDAKLPEDFTEFKKTLNANFSHIFDTKYVDSCGALNVKYDDTTLAQCYERYKTVVEVVETVHDEVEMEVEGTDGTCTATSTTTSAAAAAAAAASSAAATGDIIVSSDCVFDPNAAAFHNAGYDAYCTGETNFHNI